MRKTTEWKRAVMRRIFKPLPKIPLWRWLEKNCRIALSTGTPTPGPYRIHRAPLMKRWFDAYEDRSVRFISFAKSARVGGTLYGILCDMWVIGNRPGPILWVYPTVQTARDNSQKDICPIYEGCEVVYSLRSKDKDKFTRLFMFFRDCYVKLIGSNSPAALSGINAEHLRLDEVDKMIDVPGKEAPPAELALSRTNLYQKTRKVFRNSTPTYPQALAWQYFLKGTREYAYVPCSCCGHLQRLTFFREDRVKTDGSGEKVRDEQGNPKQTGQVVFKHCKDEETGEYDLDRVEREAYYECEEKGCRIEHSRLKGMMLEKEARWISHNPKAPSDHVSGHLTTLYSSFYSWGWIAREWLNSKATPGGRQNFFNSVLGLPFEHTKTNITVETVKNIIRTSPKKYKRIVAGSGIELPAKPACIGMQIDVQGEDKGMWWTIIMWDENWNMWLLDWASQEARGFGDLDFICERGFLFDGELFGIDLVGIDCGYRTSQVYDWCEQAQNRFPMQGRDTGRNSGMFRPIQEQELEGRDLVLVQFIDRYFKGELYQKRMVFRTGNRGLYFPEWESKPGAEDGVDDQLVRQVTNERCDANGDWVGLTSKKPDWNHLGDCIKMGTVQDWSFEVQRKLEAAEEEARKLEEQRSRGRTMNENRRNRG